MKSCDFNAFQEHRTIPDITIRNISGILNLEGNVSSNLDQKLGHISMFFSRINILFHKRKCRSIKAHNNWYFQCLHGNARLNKRSIHCYFSNFFLSKNILFYFCLAFALLLGGSNVKMLEIT